jgi:hypothetical protein
VEATSHHAAVCNLKHPTTNADVLDLDASDVLGPIPIQSREVGAWSSLFGVGDASHLRHSIAKKNAQLKRISNDRSQELKDRESAVSDEASNKRRDGGKNITTLDDFVAGRIGLAASRLHLRYCDVVDEKTNPILKTETMVMDRLEQIIPHSILAHYFYANMLRGGMTSDALRNAVESVRCGEVVNLTPPPEQAIDPVSKPTPHPSLEDFPFLFRAGDETVVLVPPPTTKDKGKCWGFWVRSRWYFFDIFLVDIRVAWVQINTEQKEEQCPHLIEYKWFNYLLTNTNLAANQKTFKRVFSGKLW